MRKCKKSPFVCGLAFRNVCIHPCEFYGQDYLLNSKVMNNDNLIWTNIMPACSDVFLFCLTPIKPVILSHHSVSYHPIHLPVVISSLLRFVVTRARHWPLNCLAVIRGVQNRARVYHLVTQLLIVTKVVNCYDGDTIALCRRKVNIIFSWSFFKIDFRPLIRSLALFLLVTLVPISH